MSVLSVGTDSLSAQPTGSTGKPALQVDEGPLRLIQELCRRSSSVTLLFREEKRQGEVDIYRGRVLRVLSDELEGEAALFHLLMWSAAEVTVTPLVEVPEVNTFSDIVDSLAQGIPEP